MAHIVGDAIGLRGIRSLHSLLREWPAHPAPERPARPMSGLFENLPTELIQVVVSALLAGDDAHASLRDFRQFACTCLGAAAAATQAHRLEAAARAHMGREVAPLPSSPRLCAYSELLLAYVRAYVENQSMMRLLAQCGAHCAYRACCVASRKDFADWTRSDGWWRSWGHVGRVLMQQAFGTAKPAVRVAVVAGKNANLLCHTDRGVAFGQHGHSDGRKGVLCVEDQPCDVYSPDRELKVAFALPCDAFVSAAASSGRLLATIHHGEAADGQSANGRRRRTTLQVWDTKTSKCVYAHDVAAIVHALWFVGARVYLFWQAFAEVDETVWPVGVQVHSPLGGPFHTYGLGICGTVNDTSVARHTGDLAILDARRSEERFEHLLFFDARLAQVRVIDSFVRSHTSVSEQSLVQFSPMGDTLVVVGKGHRQWSTLVYRRSSDSLSRLAASRRLGWRMCAQIIPSSEAQFPQKRHYPHQHSVASPCGSRMLFFFKSEKVGEVMTVSVPLRLQGEPKASVVRVSHASVPQEVAVWGSSGLYLPTGTGGGILRIGA